MQQVGRSVREKVVAGGLTGLAALDRRRSRRICRCWSCRREMW